MTNEMIKTPAKSPTQYGTSWLIHDADGTYVCSVALGTKADQIVEALNAQKTKCKTCGGTGKQRLLCRPLDELEAGIKEYGTCVDCKGTGIIPDCQPATQAGELVTQIRQLIAERSSEDKVDRRELSDNAILQLCKDCEQAVARIEELEKAVNIIQKESDELDARIKEGKHDDAWPDQTKYIKDDRWVSMLGQQMTYNCILRLLIAAKETQNGQE